MCFTNMIDAGFFSAFEEKLSYKNTQLFNETQPEKSQNSVSVAKKGSFLNLDHQKISKLSSELKRNFVKTQLNGS